MSPNALNSQHQHILKWHISSSRNRFPKVILFKQLGRTHTWRKRWNDRIQRHIESKECDQILLAAADKLKVAGGD